MEANSSEYIKQAAVKDETFHTSNAGHYILHINLDGHSGFSFSIYDSPRNKFIVLESYISRKKCADIQEFMFFLKSLISQHSELTKHKFKEIHLSISHAASTFVPSALFVEEDKEKYFLMNHSILPGEKILSDYISVLDAHTIYSVDRYIFDYFQSVFPGIYFHHNSTILVQNILIENKNRQTTTLFAHIKPDHFELILLKDHKLIFYNRFLYKTAEDFIYYILFVCEQLQLNPENAEIQLLGEIEKKSGIYALLYKYIRNIRFGKRSDTHGYSYGFNDIPEHYYYNLMAQVFTS